MPHKHETHTVETLNTGLQVLIETRDLDFLSTRSLLDRFYSDFDPDDLATYKPAGMALNPEVRGGRVFMFDDVWLVVYRRNFRVLVIKHSRYASGPHAARLQYVSYQTGDIYWIATLQISGVMFYSMEGIQGALIQGCLTRDFFIADKSLKDLVPK
jgi:hypothetical protein